MNKKYFLLLIILLISAVNFAQYNTLDSLLLQFRSPKDSVLHKKVKIEFKVLISEKKYNQALSLANELLQACKKIGYGEGVGDTYIMIGNIHSYRDENKKALESYNQAEIYFKKVNSLRGLADVNNDKSNIEQRQGNLEKSANHLLASKLYYERLNDSLGLARSYNNLGNLYSRLEDFEAAKKYYLQCIEIKRKKKINRIGITLNNLAHLYIGNKRPDSAKFFLLEALETSRNDETIRSLSSSYSIMGRVALFEKDYELAEKYYDSTLVEGKKAGYNRILINANQQLGLLGILNKNYKKAENKLTLARNELEKSDISELLLTNYKYSAMLDSARGRYFNALEYQKKYQKLSDKIALTNNILKIEQAENRFKSEMERLKLIDKQEKRELQTKEELFRYRVLAFINLGVLLVVLTFLVIIVRNRKQRKRYIKELAESNQVKNKLFSIISHDLKNEINSLEGSLKLLNDNTITQKEFTSIVPLLTNSAHQTSILLNNLLNWSKSQMRELNANPTSFDILEVINTKFTFFDPQAKQKKIQLINKLDPTLVFADKDMVSIISQNLMANAIKFCNPGDSITLSSEIKKNQYEIYFEDTGIGIDPENIHKLFAEDTFTTNGTQKETGTGLGLKICKELVQLNKGEIMVKSTLGKGSTFCVTLPIAS